MSCFFTAGRSYANSAAREACETTKKYCESPPLTPACCACFPLPDIPPAAHTRCAPHAVRVAQIVHAAVCTCACCCAFGHSQGWPPPLSAPLLMTAPLSTNAGNGGRTVGGPQVRGVGPVTLAQCANIANVSRLWWQGVTGVCEAPMRRPCGARAAPMQCGGVPCGAHAGPCGPHAAPMRRPWRPVLRHATCCGGGCRSCSNVQQALTPPPPVLHIPGCVPGRRQQRVELGQPLLQPAAQRPQRLQRAAVPQVNSTLQYTPEGCSGLNAVGRTQPLHAGAPLRVKILLITGWNTHEICSHNPLAPRRVSLHTLTHT